VKCIVAIALILTATAALAQEEFETRGSDSERIAGAFLAGDRGVVPVTSTLAPSPHRLRAATLTTVTGSLRVNATSQQDTEPAIGADVQGVNETDYIAWMQWDYGFNTTVRGAIVQRVNGAIVQTALITPAHNHANSGDPVVVVNHADTGFNPHRAYMFYTDFNPSISTTSITMSSSNNNFTTPTTVFSEVRANVMLDKPAATVSEHAGSLGDVYCVFMEFEDGFASQLLLFRLNPANGQWYQAGTVPLPFSHPYIQSPSIVVDPTNGHLYISYIDQVNNVLYMVHGTPSTGPGGIVFVTCDAPSSTGPGVAFYHNPLLQGEWTDRLDYTPLGTQGVSMITSRYNNADHSIGVVYHGYDSGVTHVYLARYVPGAQYAWQGYQQIIAGNTEEQWNGAIDDDPQGRYLLTYYARSTGSVYYRSCSRLISANGTPIGTASCWADYSACGTCPPVFPTLGEYQDVAYANGVWRSATVYQTQGDSGDFDIYHLTIQP